MQVTTIEVSDWIGPLRLSAIYCPPPHRITAGLFSRFFAALGPRFIAGVYRNAKHLLWGSRLITARGRVLKDVVDRLHLDTMRATYWPMDPTKMPDCWISFTLQEFFLFILT